MKYLLLLMLAIAMVGSTPVPDTAGFTIGEVSGYKILNQSGSSKLYEIDCPQIQDGRPMLLVELVGSHYQVGYDYAALLGNNGFSSGKQIQQTYKIFMGTAFSNPIELFLLQLFLDWQYDNYIQPQILPEFNQQLRGIQRGGSTVHNIRNLRNLIHRVLVVSSYPGDFTDDIVYAMLDIFIQKSLKIHNPTLINYVENNIVGIGKIFRKFLNRKRIHCSFFATWGSRTQGGKLYTMRNLDWEANTGINKFKLIFVWKVTDTIPHTTLGYPGVIGALTGMSQAGLTVHEAGLDSLRATELGLQWTLRLRYILMHARNLAEAKSIFESTRNTFGMNHMVGSAADVATGIPAFVVETMRDYTAWFVDNDKREDGANFTDPKTKKSFRAGYSMKDAVFRTNHGYDPIINKHRTSLPSQNLSTIIRYFVIKDSFQVYEKSHQIMGDLQALNITANVGHKGGADLYKCPTGKDDGTNVISVLFVPGESKMYAAVQYGSGDSYRTACCGVYLQIDMVRWFGQKEGSLIIEQ